MTGGAFLLRAAVDGLPRLVDVLGLALVGVGLPPVERRELSQLLLLLAQLAFGPLQVLASEQVLELFRQPGGLFLHSLERLLGLSDLLRRGPEGLVIPGKPAQIFVGGLRLFQLSRGLIERREGFGEKPGTVQVEEVVEPGQNLVPASVQRLEIVVDLALDVRDAPLCLQVLPAFAVAPLGAPPVFVQSLQLGGDLREPGGLGLQAIGFFLGGGEVGKVFLGLGAAVLRPASVCLGLAQVGREARVLAVGGLQPRADFAGGSEIPFGDLVFFRDLFELGLEALALLAGVLQLGLEGVEVGFGEAAFEEPGFRAEVVAVLAQEGLGGLDAAYAEEPGDLSHPAYALVVGEEPELFLPGVERRLEGGPVHPQQVLLDPARHVRRSADERPALVVQRLRGRRAALQAATDGEGACVGRQGHLDRGRVLGRAAAPGDGLVGEARPAAAGAEEGPQDALEEGRLAGPVRADDPDSPFRRIQLQRVSKLLVVLNEEALQDHAALPSGLPGSSLAARVR